MNHEQYMQRCLELARLGAGYVAPNPMVGAVLVHDGKIIGEGWHQKYGEAHAEVNCINQAIQNGQTDLTDTVLYVSLEPCAHHGKTPPCADLIIKHKIPTVVIGCRDPFKEVDGKGIEKLKQAGVEVVLDVLEEECKELNKRFFTFHTKQRPFVLLKWAETGDGFIAPFSQESRLLISNEYSNRLVHQWRSEEAAILVGTNTALLDNPELTTRNWNGPSPIRLVIDRELKLPQSLKLFDQQQKTIVFNTTRQEEKENLLYYKLENEKSLIQQLMKVLYELKIQSVLVEGGAKLLQSFIDKGIWDEARVISNGQLRIGNGVKAPQLSNAIKTREEQLVNDTISYYKRQTN
jgi:diaminohydroxyphosphoribosylaminopyrimidine deaminase/5-amino-6-(5-phosphoribosylamino)uracil reductase